MVGSRRLHIIRLAILDIDTPVPAVFARFPTYSSIFADLLNKAAERINSKDLFHYRIEFRSASYDWLKGECPSDLGQIDAILISGSGR
jgi:hypothetical protein